MGPGEPGSDPVATPPTPLVTPGRSDVLTRPDRCTIRGVLRGSASPEAFSESPKTPDSHRLLPGWW
jgi:hypothetical protein